MAAEARKRGLVECRTPDGRVLATVDIVTLAKSEPAAVQQHSMIMLSADEARRNSEERLPVWLFSRTDACGQARLAGITG